MHSKLYSKLQQHNRIVYSEISTFQFVIENWMQEVNNRVC